MTALQKMQTYKLLSVIHVKNKTLSIVWCVWNRSKTEAIWADHHRDWNVEFSLDTSNVSMWNIPTNLLEQPVPITKYCTIKFILRNINNYINNFTFRFLSLSILVRVMRRTICWMKRISRNSHLPCFWMIK